MEGLLALVTFEVIMINDLLINKWHFTSRYFSDSKAPCSDLYTLFADLRSAEVAFIKSTNLIKNINTCQIT